ncbi:MAG: prolyl oligopeptidase family serine peptidase [Chitinophagaceae bacterium]
MSPKYSLLGCGILLIASCKNEPQPPKDVKQYTAEQLYNNKTIVGSAFNADETKLLVDANATGIYNLYELSIADTLLKPLTKSVKESFYSVDYLPGTTSFLYSADKGGDENSHIYLQRAGDTAAKDLTPWPGSANSVYGWSGDKKAAYITSNKRNPKFFDLWKADTSTWAATMLYQNDSAYDPGVISKSERFLTLSKNITTDKNELYLYDRTNQTTKRLSNGNEATWGGLAFEKNDSILYYVTNDGSEFSYLVKYNINSGKADKFYETNWDVAGMSLSENEKYHTISVNEDGKNKVLLYDHASNKPVDFPEIKDGDVQSVLISPTEKNMMLSVGSSRSPRNIFVYNFETKTLKQLTQNLNPEVAVDELVSAEVVRFKSFDGKEIPAIYYKPLTASKDSKVPALLWIHGGPGGQSRVGFSNDIQYLVNHGYAVMAVNNRGSSGYGKTFYKLDNKDHSGGDLKDCVWAKKWLQQQDYIDTGKIGIEGGSYGGCMVLGALAFYPEEFKVGVDLFGVANWLRTLRSIPPYWESFKKALYDEMGDPGTSDSIRLKAISPLYNYEKINKPLIVFQGMNDVRVLPVESQEIVDGVKKSGTPVDYVTYPNEGHGFQKKENQITTAKKTLEFLDKYLKTGYTAPKKQGQP